jgi:hypothetical protein
MEPILRKISHDIALCRGRIIVALKIKDPEGIEMWMYSHVQCIGSDIIFILLAIGVFCLNIADFTLIFCWGSEEADENEKINEFVY